MSNEEIKSLVERMAKEFTHQGPGWSQEGVVLREVGERIARSRPLDLETQQLVLDAWHDLFADKKLGWGFDLDNPNSPFFHVR